MSRNPSEWTAFMERLEVAEQEFVQGRPAEFQSLWSRADDVTLCGGFGRRRTWLAKRNLPPRLGKHKVCGSESNK
jgi:hypothetical protein